MLVLMPKPFFYLRCLIGSSRCSCFVDGRLAFGLLYRRSGKLQLQMNYG